MKRSTKLLLASFGASVFFGDLTFAAWGAFLYAGHYFVTSWNAGRGTFKPWPKAQPKVYHARGSWVSQAKVRTPEQKLKERLAQIRNSGLDNDAKDAASSLAYEEYRAQSSV